VAAWQKWKSGITARSAKCDAWNVRIKPEEHILIGRSTRSLGKNRSDFNMPLGRTPVFPYLLPAPHLCLFAITSMQRRSRLLM
jgi:hypothetical protein